MTNADIIITACRILDTADAVLYTLSLLGADQQDLADSLMNALKQLLKDNRHLLESIDISKTSPLPGIFKEGGVKEVTLPYNPVKLFPPTPTLPGKYYIGDPPYSNPAWMGSAGQTVAPE